MSVDRGDELVRPPISPAGNAGALPRLSRLWDDAVRRRPGLRTLGKFLLVGASGYLAYQLVLFLTYDASFLWVLPVKDTEARLIFFTHKDIRLLISTLIAAQMAIVWAFTAHTNWTFRERRVVKRPLWLRFSQFNAKALVSTGGIMTVVVNLLVVWAGMYHVLAVPVGVLAGFAWNWTWDSQIIFRRQTDGQRTS